MLQRRPQQSQNTWSNGKYRTSKKTKYKTERWCLSTNQQNKKIKVGSIENFISTSLPSASQRVGPRNEQRWRGETTMPPRSLYSLPFLGIRKCWNSIIKSIYSINDKNVHFVFVGFYKSGPHFDEVDDSFRIHSVYFSISCVWRSELVMSEGEQADKQTYFNADRRADTDGHTETDRVC